MPQKCNIQWTALFIIATGKADDFQIDSQLLIDELRTSVLSCNISVVVCINSPISNIQKIDKEYIPPKGAQLQDTTTVIYRIHKCGEESANRLSFISERSDIKIQDKEGIIALLRTAGIDRSENRKYLIFTWDHGSVYGVYGKNNIPEETPGIEKNMEFSALLLNSKLNNDIRKSVKKNNLRIEEVPKIEKLLPDITPEILTVSELHDALYEELGDKKIEALIMTNCWMQAFDTGFELAESVEYLIAPETLILMTGYNYKAILEYIAAKPDTRSKEIAQIAITSYKEKSMKIANPGLRQIALNDVVISAVDLKYFNDIAVILDKMAKILKLRISTDFQSIKQVREQTTPISDWGYRMIDPYHFLNNISPVLADEVYNEYLRQFNIIHRRAVVALFIGELYAREGKYKCANPNGFTVYFPLYLNELNTILSNFLTQTGSNPNQFAVRTSWDDFIINFTQIADLGFQAPCM